MEKTLKVTVGLLPVCLKSRDQRKKSEGKKLESLGGLAGNYDVLL